MIRNNRHRKNDILIDLTSLLDVIFILLMVVLARQQITKMDLDRDREAMAEEMEELEDLKTKEEGLVKLYSDQTDMNDKVILISVSASFDEKDLMNRDLMILRNGNKDPDIFPLSGGDTADAYERFEEKLKTYTDSAEGINGTFGLIRDFR